MTPDAQSALARGREYIRIEIEALQATAEALDESFVAVVEAIEAAQRAGRKLIFSGVGKSAHIAQKLAGTFNSTGVTSCFLDATQALHGDLGLCAAGDLAVLLSNSGQTAEMLRLLAMLKRFELTLVALTGNPDSELAKGADLKLLYRVPKKRAPCGSLPPPARPQPSLWATRSPWCCWSAAALRGRISRASIRRATSARPCCSR